MQGQLLPLFPLAVVLLPGNELPLHIFEDRYKEMIGLSLQQQSEFGVVLAAQGGIVPLGCTATVEQVVKTYEDGRLDILALGRRRFRIESLDQEKEYLRATVEFFDDEAAAAELELRREALRLCLQLPPEDRTLSTADYDLEDPQLSFRLAARVTDLPFRQHLLSLRSEPERLRKLVRFAPGHGEQHRQANRLREVAPKNGHGQLPPGFDPA